MGLWDDEDEEVEAEEEYKNPYLTDPSKGLSLIAKLFSQHRKLTEEGRAAYRLDSLLDRRILSTVQELGIQTLELSQRLAKISDQIMEYQKIRLLSRKSVVGLGGQFSSGKSSFINSCLGVEKKGQEIILPEDQNPTTSIPTYIVSGQKERIYAYSGTSMIPLDKAAMKAMTHEFFKKYRIGFSRFVRNIVIHTPAFPQEWKNKIAFLDTPGYNKADMNTQETLKDEYLAKEQLKAVDFLIWLIDISNGTLHERDADFLQNVPSDTPVLVVANKADKVWEEDRNAIVESIRSTLDDQNIPNFGVTAYSSRDGIEYSGQMISDFLDRAAQESAKKVNMKQTLGDLVATISSNFKNSIKTEEHRQNVMGNDIDKAQDILAIRSLAYFYNRTCRKKLRLIDDETEFKKIAAQIEKTMEKIAL